ncbi:hypothetical protein SNEBB_002143 [Seison nebaliae]|nr:hypothetical protein SNEBB_002143 [Seison nebaliae]
MQPSLSFSNGQTSSDLNLGKVGSSSNGSNGSSSEMLNDGDVEKLMDFLNKTISPNDKERRDAENYLEETSRRPNYGPILLKISLLSKNVNGAVAASIALKNFIKKNWTEDDVEERETLIIDGDDKNCLKNELINGMVNSSSITQRHLIECISLISKTYFMETWPSLMEDLITRINVNDYSVNISILQTINLIVKRYRHESKSNRLWMEIKHVIDVIGERLKEFFGITFKFLEKAATESDLKNFNLYLTTQTLITKIFYSLNYQEFPEFFEDNMEYWLNVFVQLLSFKYPPVDPSDIDDLKSQIYRCVTLYAEKYDVEFNPFLLKFVACSAETLDPSKTDSTHDQLVCSALAFIGTLIKKKMFVQQIFKEDIEVQKLCEEMVINNLQLREKDIEDFTDNPEDYIVADLENSEGETRNRSALELIKNLVESSDLRERVLSLFMLFIQRSFTQYHENPTDNWQLKYVSISLVNGICAKQITSRFGVTTINDHIDLHQFFRDCLIDDFESEKTHPILKGAGIKFIYSFRNHFTNDEICQIFPLITKTLNDESMVIHSYAARCVEGLLLLKDSNTQQPIIDDVMLNNHFDTLLQLLYHAFLKQGSETNNYIIRAMLRTLSAKPDLVMKHMGDLMTFFIERTQVIVKEPKNATYNHCLFEIDSLLLRIAVANVGGAALESFENVFIPIIQQILSNEDEFTTYAFQLICLLLETRYLLSKRKDSAIPELPEFYFELFNHIIKPPLWLTGKPPQSILIRTLIALNYVPNKSEKFKNLLMSKLSNLLGIFQKLVQVGRSDHLAFSLLISMMINYEKKDMNDFIPKIYILVFQQMKLVDLPKFHIGVLLFFVVTCHIFGNEIIIDLIDSLSPNGIKFLFSKLFDENMFHVRVSIPELKCITGGLTSLFFHCPMIAKRSGKYHEFLPNLLNFFFIFTKTNGTKFNDSHRLQMENAIKFHLEEDRFREIIGMNDLILNTIHTDISTNHGTVLPAVSTEARKKDHLLFTLLLENDMFDDLFKNNNILIYIFSQFQKFLEIEYHGAENDFIQNLHSDVFNILSECTNQQKTV